MVLKLVMNHRGLKVYKVYVNDDPGLTLTYFTTRLRCQVGVYRTTGPLALLDVALPGLPFN